MQRLNICVDIDGTMTDPYYFIPYFNEYFGRNLTSEDCTVIELQTLYNVSREKIREFYMKEGETMHRNATILPEVREVFDELLKDHSIYIVTARLKDMEHITSQWLSSHQIHGVELHSLGSHYKVDRAKELHCDVFVEDNPEISMELAEADIQVLLMDTNYNRHVSHSKILRVRNWWDVKAYVHERVSRGGIR